MNKSNKGVSSTSCWTCRRRRVKCDRGLPGCRKCLISEEHCQGYSEAKPLRWTNGVASRGKLMGKSVPITDANRATAPIIMSLADPVVQDLSPTNRRYIKYFDRYCSIESALYGSNATNPFREFMRLIPSSSALPHAMISIAALHEARRKTEGFLIKPESPQSAASYDSPVYSDHRAPIDEDQCAVYDSLKHKQYALKQIQNEISNPDPRNIEGTIASILLLVWQDLMESGTDSWRYHLQALKEVADLRRSPINLHPVRPLSVDFGSLVRYFEMTYAALQILGTTFIQHKSVYQPLFSSISPHEMMKSSDSEIWAGCPAEILYIISVLNNIPRSKSLPIELTKHITFALNEFSPIKWAVQSHSPSLMKPRYHLASVYKQSAAIYLYQIIAQLPEDVKIDIKSPASLDSTVLHIQSINPEDPHFKGLVWPAFVIGAEAKETSQRMVVARVFEHLWDIWRCQNVRNALVVLQKLWAQNDENMNSASWIDEIYRSGIDWIFV